MSVSLCKPKGVWSVDQIHITLHCRIKLQKSTISDSYPPSICTLLPSEGLLKSKSQVNGFNKIVPNILVLKKAKKAAEGRGHHRRFMLKLRFPVFSSMAKDQGLLSFLFS